MGFENDWGGLPRYEHKYVSLVVNELDKKYFEGRFHIINLEAIGRNVSNSMRSTQYPNMIDDGEPWRHVLEFCVKYRWLGSRAKVAILFPWTEEKPQRSVKVLTDTGEIPEDKIDIFLGKFVREMGVYIEERKRVDKLKKSRGGPIQGGRF